MRPVSATLFVTALCAFAAPASGQIGIGTCVMEESRSGSSGNLHELEFGLIVHQWFDPTTCGFCIQSNGAIELRTVELDVYSEVTTSLEVPATVSVIGWTGSPDCPFPDETKVIAPPRAVTFIVPPKQALGPAQARAPFGPSPAFVSPAFLKVVFPVAPSGSLPIAPFKAVRPGCGTPCRQYQTSAFGFRNMTDACVPHDGGIIEYPYALRPRGDCVAITAIRPATWGRLKAFYN